MKHKFSGPQIFMNSVIVLMIAISAICFFTYYGHLSSNKTVLWCGIVSFMILYHFWLRIIMGNVTKLFKINPNHPWFREKPFEKKLYKLLRVRKWKDKALTYHPDSFDLKKHSLEEIVVTMTKSELDHWINEIISVTAIFFYLLWGCFPIFFITSIAAMLFDAQFIVIQRYNRPKIQKYLKRKNQKQSPSGK